MSGSAKRSDKLGSVAALAVLGVSAVSAALRGGRDPSPVPAPTEQPPAGPGGVRGRLDRAQQRRRPIAFCVGVIKKFGDDRAGHYAALIAYYGFFSLFPAMLALVTILGFVLEGREDLRRDIESSAIGQFPVIGDSIAGASGEPLSGHGLALAVGLAGALWAGLGAMQAAQDAMNGIWDVPRQKFPNFIWKRVRSFLMLLLVGGLLIGGSVLSQIATLLDELGPVARVLLIAASIALDVIVFWVSFRLLTVANVAWRQLLAGALVAGCAYYALQLVGQWYVTRALDGAENTYGTFAVVIGLLSWLYLQAQVTMFAAEINVVATYRLWPRSLFGPPRTPGDRGSLTAEAESQQMHESEDIDVTFRPERGR